MFIRNKIRCIDKDLSMRAVEKEDSTAAGYTRPGHTERLQSARGGLSQMANMQKPSIVLSVNTFLSKDPSQPFPVIENHHSGAMTPNYIYNNMIHGRVLEED